MPPSIFRLRPRPTNRLLRWCVRVRRASGTCPYYCCPNGPARCPKAAAYATRFPWPKSHCVRRRGHRPCHAAINPCRGEWSDWTAKEHRQSFPSAVEGYGTWRTIVGKRALCPFARRRPSSFFFEARPTLGYKKRYWQRTDPGVRACRCCCLRAVCRKAFVGGRINWPGGKPGWECRCPRCMPRPPADEYSVDLLSIRSVPTPFVASLRSIHNFLFPKYPLYWSREGRHKREWFVRGWLPRVPCPPTAPQCAEKTGSLRDDCFANS